MNLRTIIKQIISENFELLDEIQKGKQFDLYLDHTLSNLTPDVPEGKFDNINIMKEVSSQLKIKIDKVMLQTTKFSNFYVFKLGNFVINTNEGKEKISFIKKGEENIKYSYPYLYVYRDNAEVIRFGSRFFETDAVIIKEAQQFLKDRKIDLNPKAEKGVKKGAIKEEPGQIIIFNEFDTDNVIDMVDWSKVKRPETPKRDISPKKKNAYIVGQPFVHNLYGKGIIKKTKKFGVDDSGNPIFDVIVNFNGKEKKFRVGKKQPA